MVSPRLCKMGQESNDIGVPVFKKRNRSKAARKRRRVASDVEEEEPILQIASSGALVARAEEGKGSNKRKARKWESEQYAANGKRVSGRENATAERRDVGGERGPADKDKKPFGPMSAPKHIRTSVRVDYQADVCKDYKETGYCGFGDACKFLHDRSDYKSGWQLDRDWAALEKERREKMIRGEDPDQVEDAKDKDVDDDGLPFACYICREQFNRPIVTLCGHYFCEDCAISRLQKHSTCAICKKQLSGTFNPALKLKAKLKSISVAATIEGLDR